jgi:hypothetical protein
LQHSSSIRGDRRECVEEVSVLFLLDQTFSQRLGDRFGLGVDLELAIDVFQVK